MHTPSPPPAPDPVATANAQASSNVASAVGTQLANSTNQVTPYGNLTYTQGGDRTWTETDAKGHVQTYHVPIMTATQTLSPDQQKLYDLDNQTQQNIGQIGVQQSGKIGQLLNTPLDLSDSTIDDHLYSQYSPRVLDQQQRQRTGLESKLADQGIMSGSDAYDRAMRDEGMSENDQWNQLYLNGRGQAMQQMIQQRQEPINEVDALLSGSQVQQPSFGQTPTTSIAPPNYEGDVYNSYAAQMQGYQANLQSQNAMMGGLFGIGSALAGGWARSDRRLKYDVSKIGELPNGLPWYSYRYLWETRLHPKREGVMADEVLTVRPDAVAYDRQGYAIVDYSKVLQ